jgi:hypothetical protein
MCSNGTVFMTSFMKVSQLVKKLKWEPHKQVQTHRIFLLWKKVAYNQPLVHVTSNTSVCFV